MTLSAVVPGCRVFVGDHGYDIAEITYHPVEEAFYLHSRQGDPPFYPMLLKIHLAELPFFLIEPVSGAVVLPFTYVMPGVLSN